MDDPRYEDLLMGDISALMQSNRTAAALGKILERAEWHDRLLNGSDYPLPGVPTLFVLDDPVNHGVLRAVAVPVPERNQDHNPDRKVGRSQRLLKSNHPVRTATT